MSSFGLGDDAPTTLWNKRRGTHVTVDPQDLKLEVAEEGRGEDKLPRLTLMEALLLGIKDKEGYLSLWNNSISYALWACILMKLPLRALHLVSLGSLTEFGRYQPTPLGQHMLTVLLTLPTGDLLLNETLMMIKKTEDAGERTSTENWLNFLSGETWNPLKIHLQVKQIRERIAEGLVQKGVLGSRKLNFFIFDMITHPVVETNSKTRIISRLIVLLTPSTAGLPTTALVEEGTQCALLRTVCLACAAYKGRVMDSARTTAYRLCDEILHEFGVWPFGRTGDAHNRLRWLVVRAREESTDGKEDRGFELIAAVLKVLSKRDT
ncbi:Golgi phosphoprotein 3-domain-containing protein [Mycena vulgaris]|nr:Golgi phosphoprotein 3-domain-containing protein [Mycena vulgaris]